MPQALESRIKITALLMCLFNVASLLFIDYKKEIIPQIAIYLPIIILVFIIAYCFYKGRNWARVLIIIGSVFNLIFLLGAIVMYAGIIRKVIIISEGIFSVYLLLFLNKEATKAYFIRKDNASIATKPKFSLVKKILLFVFIIIFIFAAGITFMISKVKSTISQMDIWIEDINTGSVEPLTKDGGNSQPSFSKDGEKIVFVHNTDLPKQKPRAEIRALSLRDKTMTTLLNDENYNFSPSWHPDSDSIFYLSRQNNKQVDIWRFYLADSKKQKLSKNGLDKRSLSVSPDGRWLLFIEKEKTGGIKQDLYLIPLIGGDKIRLTTTDNSIYRPKDPAWSPDSNEIIYVSLVSLIIIDTTGKLVEIIDLSGLNNISEPFFDPVDKDKIFFEARPSDSASLDSYLYGISRKTKEMVSFKKFGLFERNHRLSPIKDKLIYITSSKTKK